MMDLSTLDVRAAAEAARDMPLRHPGTGEETGAVFHVLGFDAPTVVEAGREHDRAITKMPKDKRPDLMAQMETRKQVLAKAALVGWSGFVWEGEERAFDVEFAAELIDRPGFSWMVDQINAFGGDRANLFPQPSKA